jgi:hypothetical protein
LCAASGNGEVLGKTPLEGVARERSAGAGGEQRVGGLTLALAHPDAQDGDGLAGERGDALFPAFAQCPQVRASTELHVSAGQPQQLRDAQTGSLRSSVVASGSSPIVTSCTGRPLASHCVTPRSTQGRASQRYHRAGGLAILNTS